jgi:uncharacterized protein (DUF305 family)
MTRTFLRRALPAGALLLTFTFTAAACSDGGHSTDGSSGHSGTSSDAPSGHSGTSSGAPSGASASPGAVFNDADAAFAEHMTVHHQQAIVMSALAGERASDPRVKELATTIEAAQSPEIATMTGWLSDWGRTPAENTDGHGHESMPGMMSAADMTKLAESTGTAFDTRFLTMMIAHHEGAVTMAGDQIANGANPEAKALAAKIVTDQKAEIATMKAMLK